MDFSTLIICHFLGDYVFQNHAMAAYKKTSYKWAILHAATYSIPFVVALCFKFPGRTPNVGAALSLIFLTHAMIDRHSPHKHWMRFWGIGEPSALFTRLNITQPPKPAPPHIRDWLGIIVDNTLHLSINAAAVYLLLILPSP